MGVLHVTKLNGIFHDMRGATFEPRITEVSTEGYEPNMLALWIPEEFLSGVLNLECLLGLHVLLISAIYTTRSPRWRP